MKLQIFRKVSKFPDGKEYLLDTENDNQPAQFDSMEDIFNLFKSEGHKIESEEDLIRWGLNIEEAE
jgi:hypothetical protein